MEEKDARIVNCEQKLCIAEQKLSQFENITIDVETFKVASFFQNFCFVFGF